jgi:hypothetical protein
MEDDKVSYDSLTGCYTHGAAKIMQQDQRAERNDGSGGGI